MKLHVLDWFLKLLQTGIDSTCQMAVVACPCQSAHLLSPHVLFNYDEHRQAVSDKCSYACVNKPESWANGRLLTLYRCAQRKA